MTNKTIEAIPVCPDTFPEHWAANHEDIHPAFDAGYEAMFAPFDPEAPPALIDVTDVSLRDGLQQPTKETGITEYTSEITAQIIAERTEIFDAIVSMGIKRIEIGHLGNEVVDQAFGRHLVGHIARMRQTDSRYKDLELQVLFGSQQKQMDEGTDVLVSAYQEQYPENWQAEMAKGVVIHAYDRVDEVVTAMASVPYTIEDSARRITGATAIAIGKGFTKFSISGELATGASPEEVTQFFRAINATMFDQGAKQINNNLANTYGYSSHERWNTATLMAFNTAVKYGFEPGSVTTSMHAHNDTVDAVSGSMRAYTAGFDGEEGTAFGTGERPGNTPNIDVIARFAEAGRHADITETRGYRAGRFVRGAGAVVVRRNVRLRQDLVDSLHNWYPKSEKVAGILGEHALFRFHHTAVGNPYAHYNGSGPHDQVMAEAVMDPVGRPGDASYAWALIVNNIMGRPDTKEVAIGDPEAVDLVTVGNHAGGRKTALIKEGTLTRPSAEVIEKASREFDERKARIMGRMATGVMIYA